MCVYFSEMPVFCIFIEIVFIGEVWEETVKSSYIH